MGWHQAIGNHINERADILTPALQEEQVIFFLEEDGAAIVTAIIDMLVMVFYKGGFPSWHRDFPPNHLDFRSLRNFGSLTKSYSSPTGGAAGP